MAIHLLSISDTLRMAIIENKIDPEQMEVVLVVLEHIRGELTIIKSILIIFSLLILSAIGYLYFLFSRSKKESPRVSKPNTSVPNQDGHSFVNEQKKSQVRKPEYKPPHPPEGFNNR